MILSILLRIYQNNSCQQLHNNINHTVSGNYNQKSYMYRTTISTKPLFVAKQPTNSQYVVVLPLLAINCPLFKLYILLCLQISHDFPPPLHSTTISQSRKLISKFQNQPIITSQCTTAQWEKVIYSKYYRRSNKSFHFWDELYNLAIMVHCKCLPHENYGDWKLWGPCRENLH